MKGEPGSAMKSQFSVREIPAAGKKTVKTGGGAAGPVR